MMKTVTLREIKPQLLEEAKAVIVGQELLSAPMSHAGPSASLGQSVFFSDGISRVRLLVANADSVPSSKSRVVIHNLKESAKLSYFFDPSSVDSSLLIKEKGCVEGIEGVEVLGYIEPAPCHCPKQAYITINEGCIYNCKYCNVPRQVRRQKSIDEIHSLISSAIKCGAECISLTSGVGASEKDDLEYLLSLLESIKVYNLPIGVSVYPPHDFSLPESSFSKALQERGTVEVKFNLECATEELFNVMCPNMSQSSVYDALIEAVGVFGKNRVFTNIILGLGESDDEMKDCIRACCKDGIIPVIRPLTPSASTSDFSRPSAERIKEISRFLKSELIKNNLTTCGAMTMCTKCMGCDLIPEIDL